MTTLYITHADFHRHEMGRWHPECPERLDAISDHLLSTRLMPLLIQREAPMGSAADIALVHGEGYLTSLRERAPEEGYEQIDADTIMNPHTLTAAMRAVGAAVHAVDAVLSGEAQTAFCAVRPPGHHAEPNRAMGFCFFNNIAIAARHALDRCGLQRVAIIDFDVHHGNGTEKAFQNDPRVLMCGLFQHPFYPFSGADNPASNMVNVPVAAYTNGTTVRDLVTQRWLPRLQQHQPQLVLFSAGFDAHVEDDMGQLALVEDDFAWMTRQVMHVAQPHSQGRAVSCLEGGYEFSSLGRSVAAHIRAMAGL